MSISKAIMPRGSKAVRSLIDAGIIPAECTRFELLVDAKKPIKAVCEFFVSEEQFKKISKALLENPEEAKQIIYSTLLISRETGETLSVDLTPKGSADES